jgi:hypothetical protein
LEGCVQPTIVTRRWVAYIAYWFLIPPPCFKGKETMSRPPPLALEGCFAQGLDLSEFGKDDASASGNAKHTNSGHNASITPHSKTLVSTLRKQAEARKVQDQAETLLWEAIQSKVHHQATAVSSCKAGKQTSTQKHNDPYSAVVHMHTIEKNLDEPRHKLHKASKKRNKVKHSVGHQRIRKGK